METTAVALTSGYVLAREGLVTTPAAALAAVSVSGVSGGGRLYLDPAWGLGCSRRVLARDWHRRSVRGGVRVAATCEPRRGARPRAIPSRPIGSIADDDRPGR
jgi:hypothetical protein